MSNDLISRSALLEEINNFSMRIAGSANSMAITIMEETKKSIAKMIDEQPTTYDVDKVVERLEERKEYILKEFVLADKSQYVKDISIARINEIDGLVEIIKSGGIE